MACDWGRHVAGNIDLFECASGLGRDHTGSCRLTCRQERPGFDRQGRQPRRDTGERRAAGQQGRQRAGRQRQFVPGQSSRQKTPPPCQTRAHGPLRTTELSRRVLDGLSFQIAEDDDGAIPLGQDVQFQVQ